MRERISMRKSREILRHILDLKLPYQVAEQSLGVSHGLVCRTLAKVRERGMTWPDLAPLSEEELELLLYGPPKLPVPALAMPDWALVDYSGKRPHYFEPATGQRIDCELFVAVLGASNLTFANASATQRREDFLRSHMRAVEYFGGVTRLWIPDRLLRSDLLLLDDWGLGALTEAQSRDVLEVLEDREGRRSTVVSSQLPVEHWHKWLCEPTVADAILDRLVHRSYRLVLKGPSRRKGSEPKNQNP